MAECDKNGCKVVCDASGCKVDAGCVGSGCSSTPNCDPSKGCPVVPDVSAEAFDACHRKFADVEEFRVALAKFAESAQLNMSEKWWDITEGLWKNSQCCTCRVGNFMCPCEEGIKAAKDGGDCFCGLFYGHN